MKKKALKRKLLWTLAFFFVFINTIAFFHAYRFTHFVTDQSEKTKTAAALSTVDKIKTVFFGVNNPKPINIHFPKQKFTTFTLQSSKAIECWGIKKENAKGTVVLFHGYGGNKSSMLDKSDEFLKLGYNTILVDFMGCGGSEGNQTTIGFKEAQDVKTVFDYLEQRKEKNVYLFGTSLGAVAIMKSIDDYGIKPNGIILECPFGSMYQTTCARFGAMRIPAFPMANLLVFWGGIQNGFWAFGHRPTEYAKAIDCPTLLLYGELDKKVSRKEIDEIYINLNGGKKLRTYKLAGHENYLNKYKSQWANDVKIFLGRK